MLIRPYRPDDALALLQVFRAAVRTTAAGDYSAEQIDAWAPAEIDAQLRERWIERMRAIGPFVAEVDGAIAGYADVQADGYIDHFYVAPAYGGRGVGAALMARLIATARARGLQRLESDVSRTAQAFFTRFGFEVVAQQRPVVRGVEVPNARMRAVLAPLADEL